MLMIHNPSTVAFGNKEAMQKAIELLDEVKESIINAYEEKSGLSRSKIARMMDEETWLNAKKAQSLGLVDGILFAGSAPQSKPDEEEILTSRVIPTGHVGTTEDIAKAVLWLCSDDAKHITGVNLSVDGGVHLN